MGGIDVDAALDEIPLSLAQWLSVNGEAREILWQFIEKGEARGLPFGRVIDKWREAFPDAPPQETSNTKEWVKRERAAGRR